MRTFPILTYFYESKEILMNNSTLNLYELADIKTISVYHGLIQFFCFEKVGGFGKKYCKI